LGQGGSARGHVQHAGVKRVALIGLTILVALACAACGGSSKQAAASHALPSSLVRQIQAEIRKPSPVGGASSARTVEVYGPASRLALEKVSSGPTSASPRGSGAWYLLVLRGHFVGNLPVPPGAKQPQARIAMEVWSPKAAAGAAFSFANRLPSALSGLKGPTVIDLS
jgi:hypothetical protein